MTALTARSEFVIGYNIGFYTKAHRNLQAQAQAFNYLSGSGLTTPMRMGGFYRGIVLGYQLQNDRWLFGVRWNRKNAFSNTGENQTHTQRFRFRMTTLQLDYAYGNEAIKFGLSTDVCFIKVHSKFVEKAKGESAKWEPYYAISGLFGSYGLAVSINLFTNIRLGKYLELRPFVQLPLTTADILDDNTRRTYVHPVFNYGTSLCLTL